MTNAINAVLEGQDKSRLATVCVHGTATLYNDQMESKAIERANLSDVPLSALKGYYGHTMGAAGVLETILTMRATDDGIILPSKGFTEPGVSGKVSISSELKKTDKRAFLKLMSGFGGCNVAAMYEKTKDYSITNLTVADIPVEYGRFKIDELLFAGPVVSYGKNIVSVVTCNGKTVITRHSRKG